jgi:hypothetical protein
MDLSQELHRFHQFLPIETLERAVNLPIALLPEKVTRIVPSIVLSKDGLTLPRLLLVTDNLLCDVHLEALPANLAFDFVAKRSIKNYRLKLWTHEIKEGDFVRESYQVAEVLLLHDPPAELRTTLSYAGDEGERDAWLKILLNAIPVGVVLG